jgi:putative endonuclease
VQGKGARFTRRKIPEKILRCESFDSKSEVMKREKQLKRWSRAKKEALITGDIENLRRLSISHD